MDVLVQSMKGQEFPFFFTPEYPKYPNPLFLENETLSHDGDLDAQVQAVD
jgi:hypothetical protein